MSITYNTDIYNNYDASKNKTSPYLSKYEKTQVIGIRAQQIASGGAVFIDIPEGMTSSIDIAREELRQKRIPFIIKRSVGNETFEYWKLEDLMIR